jgi:hypothetical protein
MANTQAYTLLSRINNTTLYTEKDTGPDSIPGNISTHTSSHTQPVDITTEHVSSYKYLSLPLSVESTTNEETLNSGLMWRSSNLTEYNVTTGNTNSLWMFSNNLDLWTIVVLFIVATAVTLVFVLVIFVFFCRRGLYERVPTSDTDYYKYIYRPLQGNDYMDEEYENTFVGVSIPLLQDNTKI